MVFVVSFILIIEVVVVNKFELEVFIVFVMDLFMMGGF